MPMITSSQNPKIKQVRALQARAKARREAGEFVIEGVRLAEEAVQAGWTPNLVLYGEGLGERGQNLVEKLQAEGVLVEQVAPHVMKAASDTQTPAGLLLVLPVATNPLPRELDFVLVLDQVRDPGNLGAILRSAAAAGVGAVLMPPGSVDPWGPKVLRSAMGAHFRLPVQSLAWDEIGAQCEVHDLRVYLAAAGEGQVYSEADFTPPLALIIGGEAKGAGRRAQNLTDARVHIPMPGDVESLNAGVAAGILLFEVVRQRDHSPD